MMDDDGVASCYSPFRRGTACEVQCTLVGGVQIVIHHVPSSHVAKKRLCMETFCSVGEWLTLYSLETQTSSWDEAFLPLVALIVPD